MFKFFWLSLLMTIVLSSNGQLLSDEQSTFSRKDTLRGSLNDNRTCYDVYHYDLDVRVDPEKRYISGSNKIYFTVVEPSQVIQVDLFESWKINKIVYKDEELKYFREFNAIFISFPKKLRKRTAHMIEIFYEGEPIVAKRAPWDGGFVFDKDKEGNHWIGVACEGMGASSWWPNKDHLSEEPSNMFIRCAVPSNLKAISNGRLMKEEDLGDGYTKYHWKVSYPINNYNVSLNIGNYEYFGDSYQNEWGTELDLNYYVMPYNLEKAKKHFEQVKPMMKCYEEYLGAFPFYRDGFALIETPYLGMEHQSGIAYGNDYQTGYAGRDFSRIGLTFDYIIIHEAGHEWWGNNVSAADIADLWIHEGFCTYSEAIYVECMEGYDTALRYINAKRDRVSNEEPIVGPYGVNKEGSGDMYNKGMLFLNTLRTMVDNDTVWWETIHGLQKKFRLKQTNTTALRKYMEFKTGIDLDQVFEQYLYNAALPKFEYRIKEKSKGLKVKYRWVSDVYDFKMPLRIDTGDGEYMWIRPRTFWSKKFFEGLKPSQFIPDEDHLYIDVGAF